jgi:hypothetical protein
MGGGKLAKTPIHRQKRTELYTIDAQLSKHNLNRENWAESIARFRLAREQSAVKVAERRGKVRAAFGAALQYGSTEVERCP